MRYPNFREEKKLWRRRYKYVVGLDEAGRGPLAGPVVACALCLKICLGPISTDFKEIRDSKQLSPKKREEIYNILVNHSDIRWGIGRVSEKIVDKINILEATKLAMRKAVKNLEKKFQKGLLQNLSDRTNFATSSFLLIDGNFSIDSDIPQKSIIKGDQKVFSCAAASIIAKVCRDRIMVKYHKKYPQYAFNKHKGYGTKKHKDMIEMYGLCGIHRKTFKTA